MMTYTMTRHDDDDDDDVGNDDDDDTNDAMKTRAHTKKISEQRREPANLSHAHMASSLESNPTGGYSLIWAIQVCAAPKDRVFSCFVHK